MASEQTIVERLRDYARNCGGPPEDYLTWQAADEIERLRELLWQEAGNRVEIERLTTELKRLRNGWSQWIKDHGIGTPTS